MADLINHHAHLILKHVPMVTYVGLSLAGVLYATYLGKRYREALLLSGVCAVYGMTPYIPHF